MEKKAWMAGLHPASKLILTIIVAFSCTLVMIFIGFLVAIPFMGISPMEFLSGEINLMDPDHLNLGRYMQIISHLGMFIFPSFIMAWLLARKTGTYLYMDRFPRAEVYLLSVFLIFAAVPFINYTIELNMQMKLPDFLSQAEEWMRRSEENAERMTRVFLNVNTLSALLFNLFMIAVIPALGEEFMFRGVLLRIFGEWTRSGHLAVWITAIIFSAIHLQFFGFFPRLILGVLFGYMVLWSGSIWPAVVAHFINNAAAVTFYFFFHNQLIDDSWEKMGKGPEGIWLAAISVMITLMLMWGIKKMSPAKAKAV